MTGFDAWLSPTGRQRLSPGIGVDDALVEQQLREAELAARREREAAEAAQRAADEAREADFETARRAADEARAMHRGGLGSALPAGTYDGSDDWIVVTGTLPDRNLPARDPDEIVITASNWPNATGQGRIPSDMAMTARPALIASRPERGAGQPDVDRARPPVAAPASKRAAPASTVPPAGGKSQGRVGAESWGLPPATPLLPDGLFAIHPTLAKTAADAFRIPAKDRARWIASYGFTLSQDAPIRRSNALLDAAKARQASLKPVSPEQAAAAAKAFGIRADDVPRWINSYGFVVRKDLPSGKGNPLLDAATERRRWMVAAAQAQRRAGRAGAGAIVPPLRPTPPRPKEADHRQTWQILVSTAQAEKKSGRPLTQAELIKRMTPPLFRHEPTPPPPPDSVGEFLEKTRHRIPAHAQRAAGGVLASIRAMDPAMAMVDPLMPMQLDPLANARLSKDHWARIAKERKEKTGPWGLIAKGDATLKQHEYSPSNPFPLWVAGKVADAAPGILISTAAALLTKNPLAGGMGGAAYTYGDQYAGSSKNGSEPGRAQIEAALMAIPKALAGPAVKAASEPVGQWIAKAGGTALMDRMLRTEKGQALVKWGGRKGAEMAFFAVFRAAVKAGIVREDMTVQQASEAIVAQSRQKNRLAETPPQSSPKAGTSSTRPDRKLVSPRP